MNATEDGTTLNDLVTKLNELMTKSVELEQQLAALQAERARPLSRGPFPSKPER